MLTPMQAQQRMCCHDAHHKAINAHAHVPMTACTVGHATYAGISRNHTVSRHGFNLCLHHSVTVCAFASGSNECA
jgi:hypothetical protein